MISDVVHLFMFLLAIYMSSLEKYLFSFSAHFFNWIIFYCIGWVPYIFVFWILTPYCLCFWYYIHKIVTKTNVKEFFPVFFQKF